MNEVFLQEAEGAVCHLEMREYFELIIFSKNKFIILYYIILHS